MPLSEIDLARIDALVQALGDRALPETLGVALRRLVPDLALRQCDADDVLEEPYRSAGACDLHLLDVSAHCIRVTGDPAEASGLLVAGRAPA
ncbi:hypothetical protein [Novosphingobium mangrovi (ex Hu et al. 2023)]|uniref:Uncharacterized protein n=1 Tax=Novosphingobium mangrovi (ex Hu et al. 2023) TaxID=2930094 RepID=A0ABT0ACE2_9SPHN|nr:hypothetical protein [Novosphingobium mangrovi (ex Hu et al. 2023)]MCJ1960870.1 hypothetical protein [Novosphingobium mangrovi (ex Hu et al. 2023)]